MRKDLLVSMLAAAAATPAGVYANVNLNSLINSGEGWSISGLATSEFQATLDAMMFNDNDLVCNSASLGTLSVVVENLNKGDYTFTVGTLDKATISLNNLSLQAVVLNNKGQYVPASYTKEGNWVVADKNNKAEAPTTTISKAGTYKFTLSGKTNVSVNVKGNDGVSQFTFGHLGMQIVFTDFATVKTTIEKYLLMNPKDPASTLTVDKIILVNANDTDKKTAAALNKVANALRTELNKINAEIAKLTSANESGATGLAIYNNELLGLYNNPYTVKATIETLLTNVNNSNTNVGYENLRYANELLYNQDVKAIDPVQADLDTKVLAYQTKILELETTYNDGKDSTDKNVVAAANAAKAAADQIKAQLDQILNGADGNSGINGMIAKYNSDVQNLIGYTTLTDGKVDDLSKAQAQADVVKLLGDIRTAIKLLEPDDVDADVAAWDAIYNSKTGYLAKLDVVYQECYNELMQYTGEFGANQLDELSKIYTKAQADLKAIPFFGASAAQPGTVYTTAETDMKTLVTDAAANLTAYNSALSTANTLLYGKAKPSSTAQKDLKLQQSLNALVAALGEYASEFQTEIDDIQADIDAIFAAYNTAVRKTEGDLFPTQADVKAAQDKLDALSTGNDFVVNAQSIATWNVDLAAAVKAVKDASPSGKDMNEKFTDAYNGIRAQIDALNIANKKNPTEFTTTEKASVTNGIDAYKTTGETAAAALKQVIARYTNMEAEVTPLQAWFNAQKGNDVTGTDASTFDQKAWNANISAYATAVSGLGEDIDEIWANSAGQTIANDCTTLNATPLKVNYVTGYDSKGKPNTVEKTIDVNYLKQARKDLAQQLTQGDENAVKTQMDAWKADIAAGSSVLGPGAADLTASLFADPVDKDGKPVKGFDSRFAALQAEVDAADAKNTAAAKAADVAKAYEPIPAKFKALLEEMQTAVGAKIAAAKANVKYNGDLNTALGKAGIPLTVTSELGKMIAWVNATHDENGLTVDNVIEPAKTWYKNLLNGNQTTPKSYQKQLQEIQTNYTKDYNKNLLTEAKYKDYNGQITTVVNNIKAVQNNAKANHSAYVEQTGASSAANADIFSAIDQITEAFGGDAAVAATAIVNITVEGTVYKTVGDVFSLLDTYKANLAAVNKEIYDAFGKGQSKQQDAALKAKYEPISANVAEILKQILSSVGDDIVTTNYAYVDNVWGPILEALNKAYADAVDTYVSYSYSSNEAYRAALAQALTDHSIIYDKAVLISGLKTDVNNILNASNKAHTIITENTKVPDDKNNRTMASVMSEAQAMINGMTSYTAAVVTDANNCAAAYYTQELGAAKAKVAGFKTTLGSAGAGVSDAVLNGVQKVENGNPVVDKNGVPVLVKDGVLTPLEKGIRAAEAAHADAIDDLSPAMAEILALMAPALDATDEGIATECWTMEVENTKAAFTKANNTIVTVPETDQIKTFKTQLATESEKFTEVRNEANKQINLGDMTNNIASLMTELNRINGVLNNINTTLDNNIASDKANADAVVNFRGEADKLEKAYNDMCKVVGALDLTLTQFEEVNTPAVAAAIAKFREDITKCTNPAAQWGDKNSVLKTTITTISNNINNCYYLAMDKQYDNVEGLIVDVKVAYNQYRVEHPDADEQLAAWKTEIDKLEADLTAVRMNPNDPKFKGYVPTINTLVELEGKVEALIETISGTSEGTDNAAYDAAIAALDKKYDEIKGLLDAAKHALAESLVSDDEDLNTDLNDLYGKLEGIKTSWEAQGNGIVLTQKTYIDQMEALKSNIDAFKQVLDMKDAQMLASNKIYDTLNKELEGYEKQLENLNKMLESYKYANADDYASVLEQLNSLIAEDRKDLDEAKAEAALNSSSALQNTTYIKNLLLLVTKNASASETNGLYAAADKALTDAVAEISGGTFMNGEEILTALQALEAQLPGFKTTRDALNAQGSALTAFSGTRPVKDENGNDVKDENGNTVTYTFNDEVKAYLDAVNAYVTEVTAYIDEINTLVGEAAAEKVVLGDINSDNKVNIIDYTALVQLIMDAVEFDKDLPSNVAADINKDAKISISDLRALRNIIIGTYDEAKAKYRATNVYSDDNKASLVLVGNEGGVRRYAVMVSNADQLVGAQLDLVLPEGATLVSSAKGDRALGLEMHSQANDNGRYRVVLESFEDAAFVGQEGAVAYFEVEGAGDVAIDNVLAVSENGTEYNLGGMGPGTTGIGDTLVDSIKNGAKRIYNAAGQMLRSMQRGVNIIRNADGSTTKVYSNK